MLLLWLQPLAHSAQISRLICVLQRACAALNLTRLVSAQFICDTRHFSWEQLNIFCLPLCITKLIQSKCLSPFSAFKSFIYCGGWGPLPVPFFRWKHPSFFGRHIIVVFHLKVSHPGGHQEFLHLLRMCDTIFAIFHYFWPIKKNFLNYIFVRFERIQKS